MGQEGESYRVFQPQGQCPLHLFVICLSACGASAGGITKTQLMRACAGLGSQPWCAESEGGGGEWLAAQETLHVTVNPSGIGEK